MIANISTTCEVANLRRLEQELMTAHNRIEAAAIEAKVDPYEHLSSFMSARDEILFAVSYLQTKSADGAGFQKEIIREFGKRLEYGTGLDERDYVPAINRLIQSVIIFDAASKSPDGLAQLAEHQLIDAKPAEIVAAA